MTQAKFAALGSVSHATMRPEDLIPSFLYVLGQLDRAVHDALVEEYADVLDNEEADEDSESFQEQQEYCLESLFDAMQDYAPPYAYFGANEGDGADYGFWLDWDSVEEACQDGEIFKVDAGDEWPDPLPEDAEYVLEVTDHGNGTLYTRNHVEVWSVV